MREQFKNGRLLTEDFTSYSFFFTCYTTRNHQPIVVGSRPLVAGSLYAYGHMLCRELVRQAHQAPAQSAQAPLASFQYKKTTYNHVQL
jgi:hypothetical protein